MQSFDVLLPKIIRVILPFILLFGFYIHMHGEESPGGGFQSGIILAAGFVLIALAFGRQRVLGMISMHYLQALAAFGCLIYAITGLIPVFLGGHYLEYGKLTCYFNNSATCLQAGQKLGIFLVELGVGLTVFSAVLGIFLSLAKDEAAID